MSFILPRARRGYVAAPRTPPTPLPRRGGGETKGDSLAGRRRNVQAHFALPKDTNVLPASTSTVATGNHWMLAGRTPGGNQIKSRKSKRLWQKILAVAEVARLRAI